MKKYTITLSILIASIAIVSVASAKKQIKKTKPTSNKQAPKFELATGVDFEEGKIPTKSPDFSTAGFYKLANSGRDVFNFNVGWRFIRKEVKDAFKVNFNDSKWEKVNLPHGVDKLNRQASGSGNYQGVVWYRKHFKLPNSLSKKRIYINFEGIMGKSKIYVNGKLVKEHFGGYLPIIIDISKLAKFDGKQNIIAVQADNSDDKSFPPGHKQDTMDYSYFGGIYRDAWLVATNKIYISDPNQENIVAGGGVFVHYKNVSKKSANVISKIHVKNDTDKKVALIIEQQLIEKATNKVASTVKQNLSITANSSTTAKLDAKVTNPKLWHPDAPNLYKMAIKVYKLNQAGKKEIVDGFIKQIGIRSIMFDPKQGLLINGKVFKDKLVGANRHQDFGLLGNAVPNSLHWRDVYRLRSCGMRIIRSAHYPQDPAFMDACDQQGMFIIVATPSWQYWNSKPIFAQRVYSDIRNMIRKDRNHPSVIMWEPILNETRYPKSFAKKAHETCHEEYPYPGCLTAADNTHYGIELFDVVYTHPARVKGKLKDPTKVLKGYKFNQPAFTREWGDNVDDWNSHNSTNRVRRTWGEIPMLIQALHYAWGPYDLWNFEDCRKENSKRHGFSSIDRIYRSARQHLGGTLWCGFDCQRGYHPDAFWGGVTDVFRQKKYSWHLFKSQMDPDLVVNGKKTGPVIFVPNELSPFSKKDMVIFTNCDQVRLKIFGKDMGVKQAKNLNAGIKHPPVVFKNAFDFMKLKSLHRARKRDKAFIEVEGIIDGKVVKRIRKYASLRTDRLILVPDYSKCLLTADGSDTLGVICYLVDKRGTVKRYTDMDVRFEITGPATLVNCNSTNTNPQPILWGTAVALVKATTTPGEITIRAYPCVKTKHSPLPAELKIKSIAASDKLLFSEQPDYKKAKNSSASTTNQSCFETVKAMQKEIDILRAELNKLRLEKTENQQEDFEGKTDNKSQK